MMLEISEVNMLVFDALYRKYMTEMFDYHYSFLQVTSFLTNGYVVGKATFLGKATQEPES